MTVITGSKATTEAAGSVRLATVAEAIAGIATDIAVTPAGVAAVALEGVGGVSQAELNAVQVELDTTQAGAGLSANGSYSAPGGSIYLAASTSIVDALSLLDAALDLTSSDVTTNANAIATNTADIATNAGAISAEATARANADAALQTELDATQQGAGLEADGSYAQLVGSNYLDAATSLKGAISTLDTQLKTVADAAGNAGQLELDATQQGAGLEADGSYVAPIGTNYLGASTSLKQALTVLDGEIDTNAQLISTEATARANADTTLSNSIAAVSSDVSDLQTEVDDTQASVGLAADGSYTAPASNYLGATTTIKGGLSALDTQVKAVADALASDVTSLENADAALQTELDDTQAGAGLEADGSYVAPVGSNYLGASTSLKSGLTALDTQAKINADAISAEASARLLADQEIDQEISDLQTELSTTQTGAGLEADGGYVAPAGSNYLAGSLSIKDGLADLDVQVKVNADAISSEATTRASSISDLQTELDATQTGAGLDADGGYTAPLASNYLGASTSLKDGLSTLDTRLKQVADAAGGDFTEVIDEVDAIELSVGLEADGTLVAPIGTNHLGTITSIKGGLVTLDAEIKVNADAISAEATSRTDADAALQTELDSTQSSAGLEADGSLVAPIGTNHLGAITTLKGGLVALDTEIQVNAVAISTEASARVDGDNALNALITGLEGDIDALQLEIDDVQIGAGLEADGSYVAPAGSNYLAASTSLKDALAKLDAALKANADADAAELDLTALQDAVNALQTELDASQSSAGLEADGSFTAPLGTNHLGTISTLKGGLVTLDGEIKVNADAISAETTARLSGDSDLQAELDATQVGAGLDADGGFTAPASNYISASTSLKGGLVDLDTQVKSNADAISSEAATRLANDNALADDIADAFAAVGEVNLAVGLELDNSYPTPSGSNYLDATSTVMEAVLALDTQAKSNADSISSEATARASADSALQLELDTTQTGAGLEANGGYNAPLASNYLAASTSLKDGLSKLDTQVKSNADSISSEATARSNADSALQTEIDATQTGAGLGADGSYTAPASNYLTASTSLQDADVKLDTQVKVNADAISSEATARTSADADLQTEIDATQTGAGLDADGGYTAPASNYLAASTSLKDGLSKLDTQAKTNADAISAETSARSTAVANVQSELDATQTGAGLNANGAYTAPAGSNYLGATVSLKGGLSALDAQAKTNADAISSEATVRASADSDLQTELDASQAAVGLAADGSYTAPLGSNYLGATSTVKGGLAALDARAKTNADAISSEATARASADSALQTELDATQTGAGLNANGSFTAPASNYISTSTSLKGALSDLDTQVKVNADAISSEATARATADSALQTELDATQTGVGLNANGTFTAPASNYISGSTSVIDALVDLDTQVFTNEGDISGLDTRLTAIENNPAVNQDAFNILAAREGGAWSQSGDVVLYAPSSLVIRQSYGAWAYDTVSTDFIFTAPTGGCGDRHWQYDSSDLGSIIFTGVA